MTRKAVKMDWAYKKAIYALSSHVEADRAVVVESVAKFLRAERRRAVRACRKLDYKNNTQESLKKHSVAWVVAYNQACDDCAKAIGGGK